MGMAMGGMFGGMAQQQFNQNPFQQQQMQQQSPQQTPQQTGNPVMEKLKQLKELADMNLITAEEFENKKKELLSQL